MLGKLNRWTRHHLETDGREAVATVLEIAERGMAVTTGSGALVSDTELALKTRLRVEPAGEPAFEVHQRFRYSQFGVPGVGDQLTVRYDPADHDKIMITRLGTATTTRSGKSPAELLELVKDAKAQFGGDRAKLGALLRESVGGAALVIDGQALGAPGGETNTIGQLERLAALHAQGALTDAEFATEKAKILGA
jgi:hypothetical protein